MIGTLYKYIDPDKPDWFLDQFIMMSEVNFVVGLPKLGKDMLGAGLVSLMTTGRALPDGRKPEPSGSAIMVTPEDAPNYTTRPRLDAAGSDTGRVLDLTYIEGEQFYIADHHNVLREAIQAMPECRLVWISPLNLAAGISMRSADNTIRRKVIGPLQSIARDTGVAVVVVHHYTGDGKTIAGSQAIVDAARVILRLERDPNNSEVRVLSIDRSTCSAGAPPIRYVIEGEQPYSYARFLDPVDNGLGAAEEPIEPGRRPRPGTGSARVLAALEGSGEPRSSQWIWQETGIAHHTVKVYLGRLVEAGWVDRVDRNLYSAKVTVTAPDQGEQAFATVTSAGVTVVN